MAPVVVTAWLRDRYGRWTLRAERSAMTERWTEWYADDASRVREL
jgi:hypothetical protein